jgi:hypothetical protein
VNDHVSLQRLLALRRRSEARALDVVTRAEQACRQAAQAVETASLAVTRQIAHARIREQAMIDALLGRPVPSNVLEMVQAGLDTIGRIAEDLRDRKTTAEAGLAVRAAALARAREDYRLRQRAASKLDLTVRRQTQDMVRREAAVAEAAEEDLASGRRRPMGDHTPAT